MSEHHPDCPALYYTDKPERCRCALLAMLDRRAEYGHRGSHSNRYGTTWA